jgi:hypothetical protein
MADHGIRHYSLEIFGIGCALHETRIFYPDIGSMLDALPYFERMFGIAMAWLFVATVLLWFGFGIIAIWRYFHPMPESATVSVSVPKAAIPVPALENVSKTDALILSTEVRQFQDDISDRMGDIRHTFENYLGRIHELQMCLEHNEQETQSRFQIQAGRMSPRLIRDVRDKTRAEEKTY